MYILQLSLYLRHFSNGFAKTKCILVHSPHVPITRQAENCFMQDEVGCVVSACLLIHVCCMHPELCHTCVWPTTSHEHWLSQNGSQKFFGGRTPHLQGDRQFVYISSRMTRQLYTSASLSITVYIHPVLLAALHKGIDDRVVWLHLDKPWVVSMLG